MFGSEILDVAIGLVLVFTLVSIICTTVREGIETWLQTRAAYLERGIRELLDDKDGTGLSRALYEHPLIHGLYTGDYRTRTATAEPPLFANGRRLPSYIPSGNFALALMDIAARGPKTDLVSSDPRAPVLDLASVRANVLNIGNTSVQRLLLTTIDAAQGDLDRARAAIETWYDSAMDRVSGWYKRSSQWIIFWIGLFVAVGLNVNTVTIADHLYRTDATRAALVARAETAVADPDFQEQGYAAARTALDSLNLPIGWSQGWGAPRTGTDERAKGVWNNAIAPIVGWLLTAFAATLGAPFWFDLLNKIMVIRSTVKPREKSPEEASEDRQRRAPTRPTNGTGDGSAGGHLAAAGVAVSPGAARIVAGAPPPPAGKVPTPADVESAVDGCDVAVEEPTADEDLPPSEGGVA